MLLASRKKEKTVQPGDNKNDLLIAENGLKGKDIIRNIQFKLRKIMKAINNTRKLWNHSFVKWNGRANRTFLFV